MIEYALLIITVGICGVIGGGALPIKNSKFVAQAIAGLCFAYVLSPLGVWWWLYAVWFVAASRPGVGQPEGQAQITYKRGKESARELYAPNGQFGGMEWWQFEFLRYRYNLSLAIRGIMYTPVGVINPAAMYLAVRLPDSEYMNAGRWHEMLFPMLMMVITILIMVAR